MKFFHQHRKTGKKGEAARRARYITRAETVAEDLVMIGSGNMPENVDPMDYWSEADECERENGVTFRDYTIALPREVPMHENVRLASRLSERLAGKKPYSFAVHCPRAALEGGPQPHVHAMVSPRIPDGVVRPLDQVFRRYNSDCPALGGCRKEPAPSSKSELRKQMIAERQLCADEINRTLESCGLDARVGHRSNKDRGITDAPGRHLGAAGVRQKKEQDMEKEQGIKKDGADES